MIKRVHRRTLLERDFVQVSFVMSTYFVVYETGNASIIFVHFFAATFPHLIFLVEVTRPWHDSSNFGQIFREMTMVSNFSAEKEKKYENMKIQYRSWTMDM